MNNNISSYDRKLAEKIDDYFRHLFVTDLLKVTMNANNDAEHKQLTNVFIAFLNPWVDENEFPVFPPNPFTIFTEIKHTDGWSSYQLSPEGIALFFAWLRKHGIDRSTSQITLGGGMFLHAAVEEVRKEIS